MNNFKESFLMAGWQKKLKEDKKGSDKRKFIQHKTKTGKRKYLSIISELIIVQQLFTIYID